MIYARKKTPKGDFLCEALWKWCKNVQFFRRKNSVSLIFLCLKFVYLKNFDYLCTRKGLRKIKTIDEIGIN